ncbi:MAG: hypothetical protein HKN76_04610, partial [Saprospiraceae bacterium]|nr:hypothetical protein [Saprospiraceae bacterium]
TGFISQFKPGWLDKFPRHILNSINHKISGFATTREGKIIYGSIATAFLIMLTSLVLTSGPRKNISHREDESSKALVNNLQPDAAKTLPLNYVEVTEASSEPEIVEAQIPEAAQNPIQEESDKKPPIKSEREETNIIPVRKDSVEEQIPTPQETERTPELPNKDSRKEEEIADVNEGREEPQAVVNDINERETKVKTAFKQISVTLPAQEITGIFAQDISSNRASKNQIIFLTNQTEVKVDGHVVIERGARIKAEVKDAVSSTSKPKAFLAIRMIAVETIDGHWTELQYPVYSDRASHEVIFRKGMTLKKLKLKPSTVFLKVYQ